MPESQAMRCHPTRWGLVALALFGLTCGKSPTTAHGKRPVVVILFDALSSRHIHHLGYARETTPTLDHFAREGVSFARAFAPAPYTLASIPSLMTGTLPDRHKVVQSDRALGDSALTLAESLSAAGYQTFAAVANIQGGKRHGDDQGFEVFEELYRAEDAGAQPQMRIVPPTAFSEVIERWNNTRDNDRPPLYYLHVLQPHLPYAPPPPHRGLWLDPSYTGPFKDGLHADQMLDFVDRGGIMRVMDQPPEGKFGITREDQDALTALYDANIHYADRALSDMLAALDRGGILDEALVVITSDHGEAFWEHGRLAHNDDVFDEMLGVPLILHFPKDAEHPTGISTELVSTLDIMPTILAWLDLPLGSEVDGRPLPGFAEPQGPNRQLLVRSFHEDPTRGLRTATEKVIFEPARNGRPAESHAFDLATDPLERTNQRLKDASAGDALLQELKRRFAQLAALTDSSISVDAASDAESELIQDLGYTE